MEKKTLSQRAKEIYSSHKPLIIALTVILVACIIVGVTLLVIYVGRESNASTVIDDMWIDQVEHGISSFHPTPSEYQVYRNVMDFGCKGDGNTDDTACINEAISSGNRCGGNCGSSTIVPALIYFPSGRYLISSPIIMYYYSQLVGNANDLPIIVAALDFEGSSMLDSNPPDWYINQNNFFRQVRNFVLDTTRTPSAAQTTGIHWQVAQATSLVNIHFNMSTASDTGHQGIYMESGSGGFMSDLKFTGGKYGMWVGNQQFLSINMDFDRCDTAIFMNWNWQWTFKNLKMSNVRIGIDMSATSQSVQSNVGSILLLDSILSNVTTAGILLRNDRQLNANDVSGTLLLDNVIVDNVNDVVQGSNGDSILSLSGRHTISSWGRGSVYEDVGGAGTFSTGNLSIINKSLNLLDSEGKFFQKSRPQYSKLFSSEFASVTAGGAKGNGVADDSDAVQAVINANVNGKVVYFPSGTYVFFKTVKVPPGVRIVGEVWSVILAGGSSTFQDANNPRPVLQVADPGDSGDVEITDIMFGSKGAQPGAILVEWNIKQGSQGSAGMWDCHFRVGGTAGSNLQVEQCHYQSNESTLAYCSGVHTLLHVTSQASGYFENVWAWTADHDLDDGVRQEKISIYTGRGVLIESSDGPVWMYGMQSEHNVLYQYQLTNARNIFMTMIQSETPYYQPNPPAPLPYTPNSIFADPTYSHCATNDSSCPMSYAVRATNCSNVYIYGAGMYNFFNGYSQTCLSTESCQTSMVDLEDSRDVYMYNINSKGIDSTIT